MCYIDRLASFFLVPEIKPIFNTYMYMYIIQCYDDSVVHVQCDKTERKTCYIIE